MTWNAFDENSSFEGTPRLSGTMHLSSYIINSPLYKALQETEQSDIHKIFSLMSDKNVIKHTSSVITSKQRSIRRLILYIDASPWLYNFKMNSAAILTEWNYLCKQYNPDLICSKVDFKLSRSARKKGETGVVTETGQNIKPLRQLTQDEILFIEKMAQNIQNKQLHDQIVHTIKTSLSQSL